MPGLVNVGGAWKSANSISVNVNGVWKSVNSAYVNINGVWKPWGGLPVTPSKAFVIGGTNTNPYGSMTNTVRKLTLATETWGSGANALSGTASDASVCNQYNGYAGGEFGTTAIRKLIFSTEVTSTLSATISGAYNNSGGISNTAVAGYIVAYNTTAMRKLTFASETVSTISATLSSNSQGGSSFTNVATAGYVVLGFVANTTVQKMSLASETFSTLSSGLATGRGLTMGMSNVGTAGHVVGGRDAGGTTAYNLWEYWSYPSDTRSNGSTGLYSGSMRTGITNYQKTGYTCGGETNPNTSATTTAVSKLTFSNNSWSSASSMGSISARASGVSESPGA